MRSNYLEATIEEDIDLKNQYEIKSLPDPITIREACSKIYIDKILKNDIALNDVKLANIKIVKRNYPTAVNEHLTPKLCVDVAIDEPTFA